MTARKSVQHKVMRVQSITLALVLGACSFARADEPPLAGWSIEPSGGATISAIADLPHAVRVAFPSPNVGGMLQSPGISIRARQAFVLVFDCRSDQPRSITAGIRQPGPAGKSLGLAQRLNLTSKWTTYRLNFQANADDPDARIVFDFGADGRAAELKQISLLSEGRDILRVGSPAPEASSVSNAGANNKAKPAPPMPTAAQADQEPARPAVPVEGTPPTTPSPAPTESSRVNPTPAGPTWRLEQHEGAQANAVFPQQSPGLIQVNIQKVSGGPSWHVKLTRDEVPLQAQQPHELTFEARANKPKKISLGVGQAHAPWNNLGVFNELELKEEWQPFKVPFTPNADDANARVFFDLGGDPIGVEIRQIQLKHGMKDLLAGSIPRPAAKPPQQPQPAPPTVTKAAAPPAPKPVPQPSPAPSKGSPEKMAKSAAPPKAPGPNAISLQEGWSMELHQNAVGELDFSSAGPNAMRVLLPQTTPGPAWQVKLKKDGLAVENGKSYVFTFRARAARPSVIKVVLGQSGPPWNNLGLATSIQLKEAWQPYRLEFKANGQDKAARLQFDLGGNVGHVDIADVKME